MKLYRGKQKGFTLIELLVAIPIAGLVVAAATGAIIQLLNVNDISAQNMAIRQVQTAGSWMSRDGVQTQSASGISTVGTGIPFTLQWTFWDDTAVPPLVNETHQVTYSLVDMSSGSRQQLERREVVTNAVGAVTSDTTIIVAQYVDGSAAYCRWEADPSSPTGFSQTTFALTVTATVGSETESRTYQVRPRSLV